MRVLLTGGSGDLASVLCQRLPRAWSALRLDIRPPPDHAGEFVHGSVCDRELLGRLLPGVESVVHIAGWHGIHQARGSHDAYDFFALNVAGSFELLEAAARHGVRRLVVLSSTSIRHRNSVYGSSKVLTEELCAAYAARHGLHIVILRPRGFIPWWNREVYADYLAWARWFWGGAVHIDDVAQAVQRALLRLAAEPLSAPQTVTLDSAYEYSEEELGRWDAEGPGSSFRRYYSDFEALARRHGLEPELAPKRLAADPACGWLGYRPEFSLRSLLEELDRYGAAGPPLPAWLERGRS